MSTTIFNAPEYDPEKERRKRQILTAFLSVVIILGGLAYSLRYWPYEHRVDQFFAALENKDYKKAYGLWEGDSHWEQHPDKFKNYSYRDFYGDWGPSGEWGVIASHKIEGAGAPKGGSSGVIVVVSINKRVEPARLWVERKDKSLTWSPY